MSKAEYGNVKKSSSMLDVPVVCLAYVGSVDLLGLRCDKGAAAAFQCAAAAAAAG
jgi:hypothetical protein